jgi:hypothetical protein
MHLFYNILDEMSGSDMRVALLLPAFYWVETWLVDVV